MSKDIEEVIQDHEREGKYFNFNGIKTVALDRGSGEVVFCVPRVPTSSFLYRKVIDSLAEKHRRGVSVIFPDLDLRTGRKILTMYLIISPTFLQAVFRN